jgi:transposase
VLEEAGLAVQLVSSSQARNLPGRPKTDKEDARWIARLTEMGMLRSSFVPPPQIRALRACTRHVWDLTADRTRYWQRLEKPLEDARCKLTSVISRLAGHQAARAVIEAMIAGERVPQVPAALGQGRMRNEKLPALAEALSGMRFGPQHAHTAASLLRSIDLLDAELRDLQERVTEHLASIPGSWGVDCDGVTGPGAGRASGAAAERLDEIPGVGREAAMALIAETGLDMSRFPTPEALVSWAGLTPTARQSGPRSGRGKKGHGNTYAKRIAVLAAYAAANTDTFLGERFRRLSSRPSAAGARKQAAPSAGPSSSSSGTCSTTPPPATATSAPTGTPGTPTAAARPATPAASSKPSATTSSSPSGRTPPEPAASDNRITVTAVRAEVATGPSRQARNRSHARRLRWLFLGQSPPIDPIF